MEQKKYKEEIQAWKNALKSDWIGAWKSQGWGWSGIKQWEDLDLKTLTDEERMLRKGLGVEVIKQALKRDDKALGIKWLKAEGVPKYACVLESGWGEVEREFHEEKSSCATIESEIRLNEYLGAQWASKKERERLKDWIQEVKRHDCKRADRLSRIEWGWMLNDPKMSWSKKGGQEVWESLLREWKEVDEEGKPGFNRMLGLYERLAMKGVMVAMSEEGQDLRKFARKLWAEVGVWLDKGVFTEGYLEELYRWQFKVELILNFEKKEWKEWNEVWKKDQEIKIRAMRRSSMEIENQEGELYRRHEMQLATGWWIRTQWGVQEDGLWGKEMGDRMEQLAKKVGGSYEEEREMWSEPKIKSEESQESKKSSKDGMTGEKKSFKQMTKWIIAWLKGRESQWGKKVTKVKKEKRKEYEWIERVKQEYEGARWMEEELLVLGFKEENQRGWEAAEDQVLREHQSKAPWRWRKYPEWGIHKSQIAMRLKTLEEKEMLRGTLTIPIDALEFEKKIRGVVRL